MANGFITKKLLIKPGNRIAILPPSEGATPPMGEMPEGVETVSAVEEADVALLFVTTRDEQAQRQGALLQAAKPGAVIWICYPKRTSGVASDLSREVVWETIKPTDWRPVTQVAIDDVWSALRMRPQSDVGK